MATPPYSLADLRARRAEIEQIAASRGAFNVRVFGSVATGQVNSKSDVDILVDLKPGTRPSQIFAISALLEDALGVRVDVLTLRPDPSSYGDPETAAMADRIAKQAVPL